MITVQNTIEASIDKVWDFWTKPEHIKKWNIAIDDWYTQGVKNDLKVNGKFQYRMAKRDGSLSFDFEGIYTNIESLLLIEYKLDDDRTGQVRFEKIKDGVKIIETFEPTKQESVKMQEEWCQTVIDNFKKYVERI